MAAPGDLKILLLGERDQVGSKLVRYFTRSVIPWTASEWLFGIMHLISHPATQPRLRPFRLILNPAAYIQVDQAESKPDLSFTLKVALPKQLEDVYDGVKPSP